MLVSFHRGDTIGGPVLPQHGFHEALDYLCKVDLFSCQIFQKIFVNVGVVSQQESGYIVDSSLP